ncbi:MAG: arginine repressor [Chloroflexota bacterium]
MTERLDKRDRQQAILDLVGREPIGNQYELAARLADQGFPVTQATVSRDVAEIGLVKIVRGDRHVYVSPEDLAPSRSSGADERLGRLLADIPVSIGRSGLTLVLRTTPGMANAIGQAIDQSSFDEQEGTLAGDDTLLVLFADEPRLDRWLAHFRAIESAAAGAAAPRPTPPPSAAARTASPRPTPPPSHVASEVPAR